MKHFFSLLINPFSIVPSFSGLADSPYAFSIRIYHKYIFKSKEAKNNKIELIIIAGRDLNMGENVG